jgi:hypothetical protein
VAARCERTTRTAKCNDNCVHIRRGKLTLRCSTH